MAKFCGLLALLAAIPATLVRAQQDQPINDDDMRIVQDADLKYPSIAQTAHIQGVVVIRLKLDAHGTVVDGEIVSGNAILARASLENAKKWQFQPNVEKTAVLVYNFRIQGGCSSEGTLSLMAISPPNFVSITGCGRTVQP